MTYSKIIRNIRLEPEEFVDSWNTLEEIFSQNFYDGDSSSESLIHIEPRNNLKIYLVAGHSVNHLREGVPKKADRGTGGLALLLSQLTGTGCLVLANSEAGDSNFDEEHLLKDQLKKIHPTCVIDLHGMKSFQDSSDIDLGLGDGLIPELFIQRLQDENNLHVTVNQHFDGKREGTVTRFAQSLSIEACQVEISDALRPPLGEIPKLQNLVHSLSTALRVME